MQTLVCLPETKRVGEPGNGLGRLFQNVSGVPLLARTLAAAAGAGIDSVVIVHPRSTPEESLRKRLASCRVPLPRIAFEAVETAFEPEEPADWKRIAARLESRFLWLPWNFVTTKKPLAALLDAASDEPCRLVVSPQAGPAQNGPERLQAPIVVATEALLGEAGGRLSAVPAGEFSLDVPFGGPAGIAVRSPLDVGEAERILVRGAGKPTDGVHSNFNRRLCFPAVRRLARTPVTATMVTFAGLAPAILAGYCYSLGEWSGYVAGSLLYFISVLFDEMDGMMARIKFQESPFGAKLEAFVDFITYVFLWTGMAVGLYRERGEFWLWMGAAILGGTVMSVIMQAVQRKIAAPADRPQDHVKIVYKRFEADSGNPISRISRKLHFLTKKGAMCHYVVWFSVLGLLPAFFVLSTIGAQLLWICGFYANRLFRSPATAEG